MASSSGRDQLHGAALLPVWALRLVLMLVLLIMYAVYLAGLVMVIGDAESTNFAPISFRQTEQAFLGILAFINACIGICYLLELVALILWTINHLKPLLFLIFTCIQVVFFTPIFVINVIGDGGSNSDGSRLGGILALTIIVFLLFLGHLVYASIMYHRDRKSSTKGVYEKTPAPDLFPNGQLPSSLSMAGAHPPAQAPAQPTGPSPLREQSSQRASYAEPDFFAPQSQSAQHTQFAPQAQLASRGPFAPRDPFQSQEDFPPRGHFAQRYESNV